MPIYYDDLAIGDTTRVGPISIDESSIIEFAQSYDPQPFHVDPEAARTSMFGELVASGLHTLCLSVRLFVTEFVDGSGGLDNMGGIGMDNLRWHEPVRPGDELFLDIEVIGLRPSQSRSDRGYVDFERTVSTADGTTVLSFVSHNVVGRDPSRESD